MLVYTLGYISQCAIGAGKSPKILVALKYDVTLTDSVLLHKIYIVMYLDCVGYKNLYYTVDQWFPNSFVSRRLFETEAVP